MFNFFNKNKDKGTLILFDIGGTKMRVAVSRDWKTFGEIRAVPTPLDFKEGLKSLKNLIDGLLEGEGAGVLCGGVPGVLNRDGATIFKLPNLPDWYGRPFKAELGKMFGVPVYLENDSALSALGEALSGAGRGYDIVAFITVSTGVGGARVVNGRIDEKVFSFEPGWQIINFADLAKNEDSGYLGGYVSGSATYRHFGKNPSEISDPAILSDLTSQLAVGLYNAILFWSPEAIVLGGSMITGINPIPIDKVEEKLRELLSILPEIPKIKKAELGDAGGLYGALEYAKQKTS